MAKKKHNVWSQVVCKFNWLFNVTFTFLTKLAIKLHTNPYTLLLKWTACEPGLVSLQQPRDLVHGMFIWFVFSLHLLESYKKTNQVVYRYCFYKKLLHKTEPFHRKLQKSGKYKHKTICSSRFSECLSKSLDLVYLIQLSNCMAKHSKPGLF